MAQVWSNEIIGRVLALRGSGLSFSEVAKQCGDPMTKDSARYVYMSHTTKELPKEVQDVDQEMIVKLYGMVESTKKSNQFHSKLSKGLNRQLMSLDSIMGALESLVKKVNVAPPAPLIPKPVTGDSRPMTMELLISDIQYGQQSRKANTAVFRARLREVTKATVQKITQYQQLGYNVEKLVVALLGDIIESSHMHGHDSAIGTEFNTPEQMRIAVESLWYDLLQPLFSLGIPIHIPCVAGNHDRVESHMMTYETSKSCFSWPIYHGLKMLSDVAGYSHVTWDIAVGVFTHIDIYGHGVVYEHGYKLKPAENELMQRLLYRSRQIGLPMTYFRMGDQHRCIRFGQDELVVNPAICGDNWYSEGKGHTALAGQLLFSYVQRSDNKRPLYESFMIQLDFITRENVDEYKVA